MTDKPSVTLDWNTEEEGEIDDDFLFHLYQGGEFLRTDRIAEAKEHLEKALVLKPSNPRGQNMLGLVYFKLGLFAQAIELYQGLVKRYPGDPTLRVNLAMVHLKAEALDAAEEQLRSALEADPEHVSAHRYLGLVLMRRGQAAAARPHLERAGVRNLDRLLASEEDDQEPRREVAETTQRRALAAVADQGFRELEEKETPFRAVGKQPSPPPAAPVADGVEAWSTLDASRAAAAAPTPGGPAPRVFRAEGGQLEVDAPGPVFSRLVGLQWLRGQAEFEPVRKRFAGKETKHPFDRGERGVVLAKGPARMSFLAPTGERFSILRVEREPGYFLEQLVFAFSESTSWENGRLPAPKGEGLPIFHLFGAAELVLCCQGDVVRQRLLGDERFALRASRLVGWTGNLVPRLSDGEPPWPEGLWIELSGSGEVLLLG
ncbi:MAG TPA: tetratricopeptide repeat protein [Myxococcota bacterium]|nr:tetratricopeptide repeat protein [Myxococcota bacterium]HRY96288.1 tetratricopeptide repeat protein [Myxococcota bacterium]HSA22356.1 tetratricopeptide repeat protein [Myxococcota bacterium]